LPQPLNGLRVLDLSRILSGPYATMTLADLGAEVIKVEAPVRGDDTRSWGPPFLAGESTYYLSINRSKLGITLNFKKPAGRRLLDRLIAMSDILVENFRPGTMDDLHLGYEALHQRFPRLIYCSISGYGHSGPRQSEPGYDVIIQGESGVMSLTGSPDGPPFKMGVSIADIVTGMYAVQGILAALYHRESTGTGQKVDVALLDSMVSTLTYQAGIYFASAQPPVRMGNRHPSIVPYEMFEAADGYFNFGAGNDAHWRILCEVLGMESMADDPEFASVALRVRNADALRSRLSAVFREQPVAHWLSRLRQAGLPCGEVRSVGEALGDPQLEARGMILEVDHPLAGKIKLVGSPLKMSGSEGRKPSPPPRHGEHNHEVYCGLLGVTPEEMQSLIAEGVV